MLNQFKKITGLTPSHYKQMKDKKRSPIEDIGPDINPMPNSIDKKLAGVDKA